MKNRIKDVLFFGGVFTLIDQVIKILVSKKYSVYNDLDIGGKLFSIKLTHNTGAAFSLFNNSTLLLIIIGIIALLGLILYVNSCKELSDLDVFVYSLLFGGILGNLIDRIFRGYVIDFISINAFKYQFPIFNIADIFIVTSVILIILVSFSGDSWKS